MQTGWKSFGVVGDGGTFFTKLYVEERAYNDVNNFRRVF